MTTVLNPGQYTVSLLDAGRNNAPPGAPGLSKRARAITQQFLNQSAAGANQLFSLSATSAGLTPEQLQTQIKALRARFSPDQLARSLQPEDPRVDNGNAAASSNGRNVDTTA